MYYTTTDRGIGCGGNLTSFNGTFTSPLYPNFYYARGDQKECLWTVHSLGQNKLEIRFETFEFNNTNRERCNVTYLDIFDGDAMNNETHLINLCPQVGCKSCFCQNVVFHRFFVEQIFGSTKPAQCGDELRKGVKIRNLQNEFSF